MIWFVLIPFVFLVVIPFICGMFGIPFFGISPLKETNETDDLNDLNKQERRGILDETIVKYNKLVDNLAAQYKAETDEKKKAVILSKQIATLEKLNKALEKIEKLE